MAGILMLLVGKCKILLNAASSMWAICAGGAATCAIYAKTDAALVLYRLIARAIGSLSSHICLHLLTYFCRAAFHITLLAVGPTWIPKYIEWLQISKCTHLGILFCSHFLTKPVLRWEVHTEDRIKIHFLGFKQSPEILLNISKILNIFLRPLSFWRTAARSSAQANTFPNCTIVEILAKAQSRGSMHQLKMIDDIGQPCNTPPNIRNKKTREPLTSA